jgi:hypothetical protein
MLKIVCGDGFVYSGRIFFIIAIRIRVGLGVRDAWQRSTVMGGGSGPNPTFDSPP